MTSVRKTPLTLKPIKPNVGIRVAYRKELEALVEAMRDDLDASIMEEFDRLNGRIKAQTAIDGKWRSPAEALFDLLEQKKSVWRRRIANKAFKMSESLVRRLWKRVHADRAANIRELGFKDFKFPKPAQKKQEESLPMFTTFQENVTPAEEQGVFADLTADKATQNMLESHLYENARLIRTIPDAYLDKVDSMVQQAVSNGLDRAGLKQALKDTFHVTERRAQIISRDQVQKATEAINESTDADLGLTEGIWVHVPGRKQSRPTHVKMDGKKFKLDKGLYDSAAGEWVKPAQLPLCACTYRVVIPDTWRA